MSPQFGCSCCSVCIWKKIFFFLGSFKTTGGEAVPVIPKKFDSRRARSGISALIVARLMVTHMTFCLSVSGWCLHDGAINLLLLHASDDHHSPELLQRLHYITSVNAKPLTGLWLASGCHHGPCLEMPVHCQTAEYRLHPLTSPSQSQFQRRHFVCIKRMIFYCPRIHLRTN